MFTRGYLPWNLHGEVSIGLGLQPLRSADGAECRGRRGSSGCGSFLGEANGWLVVSNMNFIFHVIYGIILPIDFHIFQDG